MKKIALLLSLLLPALANAQPGVVNTKVGNGSFGFSGDGGPATAAGMRNPAAVAFDASGNMYVADYSNSAVRKINTSGVITTIAGMGSYGFSGDGGPATAAYLDGAKDVAVDAAGNVYVADYGNNVVRKINTSGIISTFAGNYAAGAGFSGDGGAATAARLNRPSCVKFDASGNLLIADCNNNRIRKVNTAGIISTIAGNGAASFGGDGGPATAASFNSPIALSIDRSGNIIVADKLNYRVRLINTSGIIRTIAGNGTSGNTGDGGLCISAQVRPNWVASDAAGRIFISDVFTHTVREINPAGIIGTIAGSGTAGFSGDGGAATAARFNGPEYIAADAANRLYITDVSNQRIRTFINVDSFLHSSDSMDISVFDSCGGIKMYIITKNYTAGQTIKTFFGDGSFDTATVAAVAYGTSGIVNFTHAYTTSGNYTIKSVVYSGSSPVDSITYSFYHYRCSKYFSARVFDDINANCLFDTLSEYYNYTPMRVVIDSNAHPVDSFNFTSGFYYSETGNPGDVYKYTLSYVDTNCGYTFSCAGAGILLDTVGAAGTYNSDRFVAQSCNTTSSVFNLYANDQHVAFNRGSTPYTTYRNYLDVGNFFCIPTNGIVTMTVSNRLALTSIAPYPTLISGNVLTWNVTGLSSSAAFSTIYVDGVSTGSVPLTTGDTLHTTVRISPTTGDADSSDNMLVIVDTVLASYDPNYIVVAPSYRIASGDELEYTIHFENTGSGPAFNIHVLDTLPDNVDISSYKIVAASHAMFLTKLKDFAGHNVLKFEFPDINLPDSSHHGLCDGFVKFRIKSYTGLPDCDHILNRAGIYFDFNEVVMTNMVDNVVGCNLAVTDTKLPDNNIELFPNPADDVINIKVSGVGYSSYIITNNVGQSVASGEITHAETTINTKHLNPGLYMVTVKGDKEKIMQKFLKL